jgi:signal transduction histidine kinase/DNA-binding response OmpR family regulator/HAMP domain-containing protein
MFIDTDYKYSNLITGTLQRHVFLTESIEAMTRIRFDILSRMYSAAGGARAEIISGLHKDSMRLNDAFSKSITSYYDGVRSDPGLAGQETQERLDALAEIMDLFFNTFIYLELDAYAAAERGDTEMLNAILPECTFVTEKIAGKLEYMYHNAFITVENKNRDVMNNSVNSIILLSAVCGIFAAFSILVSVYIIRAIRTPISAMHIAMTEISKGNLSFPIRSENKDELGRLSNDIADMVDQISEMNKTVAIMDFLDSMINIVSLNFNIIYMNEKMAEAYGVDKEKSINQKCYKVLHDLDKPCPHCLWPRTLSTKEQNKLYIRDRFWDQKLGKWLGGKAAIIRWIDGFPVQFYYLIDETMHHNYEAKLQEAAEEAQAASLSKTAFLANMSHEIRTPMNAILGITEIQMENKALPPPTQEALGKIYNSGDLLLGIINDILDMSKIEAGKMELFSAKYETVSLISDTITLNMMRFASKPIDFRLQINENVPSMLTGDELRIKQILNNLLSNAAKYTQSGEVIFSVNAEPREGDNDNDVTLIFQVKDTGQGMSPEQVSKIFDAYSRFNMDVNRTVEGTGLGMSITAKLLHMMNGKILVESEPGKGSAFTVLLPQNSAGSAPLGRELAENLQQFRLNSLSQQKTFIVRDPMPYGSVLIVDDMDANLYVARGLMTPYGLRIDTATSGFEAIEKITSGKEYDIVFMDHMMPKMDGIEATKIIRGMGYTRSIVALTANAVAGQADIFLSNGFDEFISKPINTRHLNEVLNRLIRDKQSPEVLEAARQQQKANQKDTPETPAEISVEISAEAPVAQTTAAAPLLEELSRIEGLDVHAGLSYIGEDQEGYFGLLRFFSERSDIYLEELARTLETGIWKDYTIKVHALKGVLANIGAKGLSQWAAKLEKASKTGDDFSPETCKEETRPFCADLCEFRDKLRRTSLFESPVTDGEKPRGDTQFLKGQIELLKEACIKYSFGDTKKIIAVLGEYKWDDETEKELERIRHFMVSLDYDKALEGMNSLL